MSELETAETLKIEDPKLYEERTDIGFRRTDPDPVERFPKALIQFLIVTLLLSVLGVWYYFYANKWYEADKAVAVVQKENYLSYGNVEALTKAKKQLEGALTQIPDHEFALGWYGDVLATLWLVHGDEKAKGEVQEFITKVQNNNVQKTGRYYLEGAAALMNGDLEGLNKIVEEADTNELVSPKLQFVNAMGMIKEGKTRAAIDELRAAKKNAPTLTYIRTALADLLAFEGNSLDAKAEWYSSANLDEADIQTKARKIVKGVKDGDKFNVLVKEMNDVIKNDVPAGTPADLAFVSFAKAEIAMLVGDKVKAEKYLNSVNENSSIILSSIPLKELAKATQLKGEAKYDEANQIYQTLAGKLGSGKVLNDGVDNLIAKGDITGAEAFIAHKGFIKAGISEYEINFQKGVVALAKNDTEVAKKIFGGIANSEVIDKKIDNIKKYGHLRNLKGLAYFKLLPLLEKEVYLENYNQAIQFTREFYPKGYSFMTDHYLALKSTRALTEDELTNFKNTLSNLEGNYINHGAKVNELKKFYSDIIPKVQSISPELSAGYQKRLTEISGYKIPDWS